MLTLLQNSVYPLSFDPSYIDVLVTHGLARTISNGDVKIAFAQNRKLRALWGLPRFRIKGCVEKTFISISLVMFLLLRLLILTWIS